MAYLDSWVRKTTELSSTTKLFLYALSEFADNQTGECYPSQGTIATAMSMSLSSVQRCLKECLELNLVQVKRRWKKSNVYKLLCIKKPELSPMTSLSEAREQPPSQENKTFKQRSFSSNWKDPSEVQSLVAEIERITKDYHSKGAFFLIAREVSEPEIYQALSITRSKLQEQSGVNGGKYFIATVRALSGFQFKSPPPAPQTQCVPTYRTSAPPQQLPEPEIDYMVNLERVRFLRAILEKR